MNNNNNGTITFLAGLLLGGLVGAAIGMLVAPETGEETRAKLKKEGERVLKNSLKTWNEFEKKELRPAIEKVSDDIKERVEKVTQDLTKPDKNKK